MQAITFTLLPQLENENAEQLLSPRAGLVNGLGLGCCLQEVFDSYGPPSELTGPEGESGWWTIRYNQDNCRRMNFLFVGDGPYLVAMQLMLTPES